MNARFALLCAAMLLAGCASDVAPGEAALQPGWPSLEPRANELSPLVPRVPAGACAVCGPDVTAAVPAPADLAAPARPVLPLDVQAQLQAIEAGIADVEARWPQALDAARAAVANARPEARPAEAEVQASRYEALFQPLGRQDAALANLEVLLPDAIGGPPLLPAVALLRTRLAALERARDARIDAEPGRAPAN